MQLCRMHAGSDPVTDAVSHAIADDAEVRRSIPRGVFDVFDVLGDKAWLCLQPHSGSNSGPDRYAFLDARPNLLPVHCAGNAGPNPIILRSQSPERRADRSTYHTEHNGIADALSFARSDGIADSIPVARTHVVTISHPDGPTCRFADERSRGINFAKPNGSGFDQPDVRSVGPSCQGR